MRRRVAALLCVATLLGAATPAACAEQSGAAARATRLDLIGSWRLVSIDIEDARGTHADPFYGSGTTGLLIYDAAGWVSVQIAGTARPRVDAPALRPGATERAVVARAKAKLLDSYYAYFGTWEYDSLSATVTHRVETSLYTGEEGASYAQQVQILGRRMVFTRTRESAAGKSVQRKIWEKIDP